MKTPEEMEDAGQRLAEELRMIKSAYEILQAELQDSRDRQKQLSMLLRQHARVLDLVVETALGFRERVYKDATRSEIALWLENLLIQLRFRPLSYAGAEKCDKVFGHEGPCSPPLPKVAK